VVGEENGGPSFETSGIREDEWIRWKPRVKVHQVGGITWGEVGVYILADVLLYKIKYSDLNNDTSMSGLSKELYPH
jgi:hypothetical protein